MQAGTEPAPRKHTGPEREKQVCLNRSRTGVLSPDSGPQNLHDEHLPPGCCQALPGPPAAVHHLSPPCRPAQHVRGLLATGTPGSAWELCLLLPHTANQALGVSQVPSTTTPHCSHFPASGRPHDECPSRTHLCGPRHPARSHPRAHPKNPGDMRAGGQAPHLSAPRAPPPPPSQVTGLL